MLTYQLPLTPLYNSFHTGTVKAYALPLRHIKPVSASLQTAARAASQGSRTPTEERTICPPLRPTAHWCPRLASVTMIDRGVCSPSHKGGQYYSLDSVQQMAIALNLQTANDTLNNGSGLVSLSCSLLLILHK